MTENNRGFIGFCFGVLITTFISIMIFISPTNYKVKTPVTPKIQITYTEGVPDTIYIYKFN